MFAIVFGSVRVVGMECLCHEVFECIDAESGMCWLNFGRTLSKRSNRDNTSGRSRGLCLSPFGSVFRWMELRMRLLLVCECDVVSVASPIGMAKLVRVPNP